MVALCLFCSGLCALIYQTAWLREFRLIFGASTASSAAVLAIFMGGVGLGSTVLGKKVDRLSNPFRFYAKLEGFIALSAALTPLLIVLARHAYIFLGGTSALGLALGTALRLILASIVLLVPTFLMGGTLPAVVRALQTDTDPSRRRVAFLYGVNVLGAVIGAMLSTFILFERLGNRMTIWSACAVNLAVALAALRLSQSMTAREATKTKASTGGSRAGVGGENTATAEAPSGFVFAAAAIVGFAFFLLELVWYRMLSPILGGSSFTFGLILAVALSGMAAGSLLYSVRKNDRTVTLTGFAWVCGLEALLVALPYALGDRLALLAIVLQPLGSLGFTARVVEWSMVAGIVIFPAAIVAGYQFPMLIALLGRGHQSVGSQTGVAYGWSTLGAIGGSFAGGFGLMPVLTAPGTWRLVVVLLALLSVSALFIFLRAHRRFLPVLPSLAVLGASLLLLNTTGPTAAWRHSPIGAGRVKLKDSSWNDFQQFLRERRRVLHWEAEGLESSVALICDNGFAFVVNGKVDGNARTDAGTQVMCGLLGALIHPEPRRSLVIGLGTGSTAGWLGDVPTMERVDVVELEPAMRKVAESCAPVNRNALANPKVHLWFGDAREFVLTTRQDYDLIASEPSNPYRAGVASLFTREFYEAAARRLRPQGLFSQWVQAYEVDGETISTIYATLSSVFPTVETWKTQSGDLLFIGSKEPIVYHVPVLRQKIQGEPYKSALAQVWRVTDLEGVFARYIARRDLADAVAAGDVPVSTDDRNRLEFAFARTVGRKTGFNIDLLYQISCEQGYDKPVVSGGELDWSKVDDRRVSALVLDGESDFKVGSGSEEFRARTAAKAAYVRGDFKAALNSWQGQTRDPGDLIELLLLAHCLAARGENSALRYIERLRDWIPNEADALLAQYLWLKDRPDGAFELAEKSLAAFRADPWPPKSVMAGALETAKAISKQPGQMQRGVRLHETLREPFAVGLLETERTQARLEIARRLDESRLTHLTRDVIAELEPNVLWTHEFLRLRTECYSRAGDPRALAAVSDLEKFEANEARPFLFSTRDQLASHRQNTRSPSSPARIERVHAREK